MKINNQNRHIVYTTLHGLAYTILYNTKRGLIVMIKMDGTVIQRVKVMAVSKSVISYVDGNSYFIYLNNGMIIDIGKPVWNSLEVPIISAKQAIDIKEIA